MAKRKQKDSSESKSESHNNHNNHNNNNSVADYREATRRVLGLGADAVEEEYQQLKKEKKLAKAVPGIAKEENETEKK